MTFSVSVLLGTVIVALKADIPNTSMESLMRLEPSIFSI